MMTTQTSRRCVAFRLCVIAAAGLAACQIVAGEGRATRNYKRRDLGDTYTVDWVGNTYGGEHVFDSTPKLWFGQRRVSSYVAAMFVAGDGTCYTNATWEERGGHISAYRDGKIVNIFSSPFSAGMNGGPAVTADRQHVYAAMRQSGGTWRPKNRYGQPHRAEKGETWYAVRRYDRTTGKPAGFRNGYGKHAAQLVVSRRQPVTGLAVVGDRLVVGMAAAGELRIYRKESLAPTGEQAPAGTIPLPGVGQLADAGEDACWALVTPPANKPARLVRVDLESGRETHRIVLPENMIPAGIAVDRSAGTERLLVCDRGPDRNITVYSLTNKAYQLTSTIGAKGGLCAGTPGLFNDPRVEGPKFRSPLAAGVDDQGNLYVADSPLKGPDFLLRSFDQTLAPRWTLAGVQFTDSLATDPGNPHLIYSPRYLYRYDRTADPTKPSGHPGRRGASWDGLDVSGATGHTHWSLIADTRLFSRHPDNPCNMRSASVRAVEIEGRLLIGLIGGSAKSFAVLRQSDDPDVPALVPYAFFGSGQKRLPAAAGFTTRGGWFWMDTNRNGRVDPGECQAAPEGKDTWRAGFFFAANGDIYLSGSGGVVHFRAEIRNGLPVWSYDWADWTPRPEPFTALRRAMYDETRKAMFLTGYTKERPNAHKQSRLEGYWKKAGKVLVRYDNWPVKPTLAWQIDTPWDDEADREAALALDIAGDYIFLVIGSKSKTDDPHRRPIVFIYRKADGGLVGTMQPKSPVSDRAMVDMAGTINAVLLPDGRYRVHCMDDAYSKGLIYHWSAKVPAAEAAPGTPAATSPSGATTAAAGATATKRDSSAPGVPPGRSVVIAAVSLGVVLALLLLCLLWRKPRPHQSSRRR